MKNEYTYFKEVDKEDPNKCFLYKTIVDVEGFRTKGIRVHVFDKNVRIHSYPSEEFCTTSSSDRNLEERISISKDEFDNALYLAMAIISEQNKE